MSNQESTEDRYYRIEGDRMDYDYERWRDDRMCGRCRGCGRWVPREHMRNSHTCPDCEQLGQEES